MKYLKQSFPIIFIFLLSLISTLPFFHSGFFPIHDNTQVQRVFEMTKSIKDGLLPVRWVSDLGFGYGYPIFNFYAPLAYYLGSLFNLLGVDVLFATKLMMALGVVASGLSMYFLAKEIWGKFGGILSALLYVFAPYHALDIYVRGDVAEFWAYAFIPLVFYSLLKIHKTGKFRFIVIGAFTYAALIVSHNLTALMATPFILVFSGMLYIGNKKTGKNLPTALLLGLLLSALYWVPALFEINYTNVLSQVGGGADYKDHFICLNQLWSSPWGFGGSAKGCVDGLSLMLGKIHILLAVSAIIIVGFAFKFKKINSEKIFILFFFFLALAFSLFLTLDYSRAIWDFIKPMAIFQYPWRFLLMATFFASLLSGSIIYCWQKFFLNQFANFLLIVGLSILVVLFNAKYFNPQKYLVVSGNNYTNDYFLKFVTSQISSEYMPKNFLKPSKYSNNLKITPLGQGKIVIKAYETRTGFYSINYILTSDAKVIVPIAYFPSWEGYLDGAKINLAEDKKGMLVSLPQGSHQLILFLKQTPIEVTADLFSVAGILTLFVGIIYINKRKYA